MQIFRVVLVSAILCLSWGAQAAHITVFNTVMTGDQANAGAGTGSAGKGATTATYNSNTMEFSWFVAWENLSGPATAAHFHVGAPNMNGGVVVPIGVTSNPAIGSAVLTQAQVDDLFAGLFYVNIHTSAFPGGEIRGQLLALTTPVPLPAAVWLFGAALAGLGGFARRR